MLTSPGPRVITAWQAQRADILRSAMSASPGGSNLPVLLTLRSATSPPTTMAGTAAGTLPLSAPAAAPAVSALRFSATLTNPQTPRGQEIMRSLSEGNMEPATPRTIADRVGRARRAGLKTTQKAKSFGGRLSVPIGSPSKVPLPAQDAQAAAGSGGAAAASGAGLPELRRI